MKALNPTSKIGEPQSRLVNTTFPQTNVSRRCGFAKYPRIHILNLLSISYLLQGLVRSLLDVSPNAKYDNSRSDVVYKCLGSLRLSRHFVSHVSFEYLCNFLVELFRMFKMSTWLSDSCTID